MAQWVSPFAEGSSGADRPIPNNPIRNNFAEYTQSPYRPVGYTPYSAYSPYTNGSYPSVESNFNAYRSQVSDANQALGQQPRYRALTPDEQFMGGLNQATEALSGGASQALGLGAFNPEEGFTPANVARFAVNLPGNLLSAPLDLTVHAGEVITGKPYTEITEEGLIPDYQLSADQRLASLGYVGLDALGFLPGIGPEARAAGLAVKGAGRIARGLGKETAADALKVSGSAISHGLVKDATGLEAAARLSNASDDVIRAARAGDIALDVGISTAFEGAQEGAQTAAEEFRYKTWDENSWKRIADAAAWGALGGGIVSGTSNAFDHITNVNGDKPAATTPQFERDKERNQTTQSGTLTTTALSRINDDSRKRNDVPGSTSAISTMINRKMRMTQISIGEKGIHAMLQADDSGESLNWVAKRFRTTAEEILKIDRLANSADRTAAYNALIDKARKDGRCVTVSCGRNPDSELGSAAFDLVSVFDGNGISMNRHAYMAFGGDTDGDTMQIYFGQVQNNGYLTKNLISAIAERTRLKEEYTRFSNSKEELEKFDRYLHSIFDIYNFDGSLDKMISGFKGRYAGCFKDDGSFDIYKIAQLFTDIRREFRNLVVNERREQQFAEEKSKNPAAKEDDVKIDQFLVDNYVDNIIADFFYEMDQGNINMPQAFIQVVKKLSEEEQKALDELNRVISDATDRYLQSGDTRGATDFAEFVADLGYKINASTTLGNPFFRQSGQIYYHSKEATNYFGAMEKHQIINVFEQLIAFSFNLTEVGGDVETAIEGIWKVSVQDKLMDRLASKYSVPIDLSGDWDLFYDDFIEIHDEMVNNFNTAFETASTRSDAVAGLNVPHKVPLKKNGKDPGNRAVAREFMEIFGGYTVQDIINIPSNHPMYGQTFEQAIEEYATLLGRSNNMFSNYEGFNKFWQALLEDYDGKQASIGTRVENVLEDIASKLSKIGLSGQIFQKEDGSWSISPDAYVVLSDFVEAYNTLLPPGSERRLSLATIESYFETQWGREMFSGDANRMKRSFVSQLITDRWGRIMDMIQQYSQDLDNPATWNKIVVEASYMADISVLDAAVYYEMKEKGSYALLDQLTNLDVSWDSLTEWFHIITGNTFDKGTLMSCALCSNDSEMSASAFSKRLGRVSRFVNRGYRRSYQYNKRIVDNIRSSIEQGQYTVDQAAQSILEFCKQEYVEMSIDTTAAFVYSQRQPAKAMADKGQSTSSSGAVFQSVSKIFQGDILSIIDQWGVELGNLSIGNFQANRLQILKLLTDPTAEVRVWDPMRDSYIHITQKTLFEEYNVPLDENGLTSERLLDLLDNAPQLASIIAPSRLGVSGDSSATQVTEGSILPLDKAIAKRVGGKNRESGQENRRKHRNFVKQRLFQDSDWWGLFVASCPELLSTTSMAETRKIVEDHLEKHVDFFYDYAAMSDGDAFSKARSYYSIDTFSHLLEQALSTLESIDVIKKLIDMEHSVSVSLVNKTSFNVLSLIKWAAISKVFSDEGKQIVPSFINPNELNTIQSYREFLARHFQEYLDMAFALINMMDYANLDIDALLDAGGINDAVSSRYKELQDEIDKKREKLVKMEKGSDAAAALALEINEDEKSLQTIKDKIEGFGNGLGFIKAIVDPNKKLASDDLEPSPDLKKLIIQNDCTTWTQKQWIKRCQQIMEKYGRSDEFNDDAIKEIKEAINDSKKLEKIRLYYNGVIVSAISTDWAFGTGRAINSDATKQGIEAHQKMMDIATRIRNEAQSSNDPFEERGSRQTVNAKLPDIEFYYDNPALTYMATSATINAQSSSVGTGIGVDGAMVKLIAAFGALPVDDDCGCIGEAFDKERISSLELKDVQGWSYKSPDGRLHRIRRYSDLRKIQGDPNGGYVFFDPKKCMGWTCKKCGTESKSSAQPRINIIAYALSELASWMQEARHLQAKKVVGFSDLIAGKLDDRKDLTDPVEFPTLPKTKGSTVTLSREALAEILFDRRGELAKYWADKFAAEKKLPLGPEVAVSFAVATTPLIEVRTSDGKLHYVSAHSLVSDAEFQSKNAWFSDDIQIETVRPVVMSFQEVAAKITRDLCKAAYVTGDINDFDIKAAHAATKNAFYDWSSYENPTNRLSIKDVFDGIIAHDPAFNVGVIADSHGTPRQRWDNITGRFADFTDRVKDSRTPNKLATENASHVITSKPNFGSFIIAYYSCTPNVSSAGTGSYRTYQDLHFAEHEDGNQTQFDGRTAAELFEASVTKDTNKKEISEALNRAYRRAKKNGRSFIFPKYLLKTLNASDSVKGAVIEVEMNGDDYLIVEPSFGDRLDALRGEHVAMAVEELDPSEITTAVASGRKLDLTDSGSATKPGYQVLYTFRSDATIPLRNLLGGVTPIEVVNTFEEISKITPDQVDYSYYEKQPGHPDIQRAYVEPVERFISEAGDQSGDSTRLLNVSRGSCIGFVKQTVRGTTKYAPLFFDGSVPDVATFIKVKSSRGNMKLTFSTNSIDYNSGQAMKLDLYGVSFKTVSHTCSQEEYELYWPALDDRGHNVITEPEYVFDEYALASRVFQMTDDIVKNNLFYYTRKAGCNLLVSQDPATKEITRRNFISKKWSDAELSDLANGSLDKWLEIADGRDLIAPVEGQISADEALELNKIIRDIVIEMYLAKGFPHLFFNSRQYTWSEATGEWTHDGLWPRDMTFKIALKNCSRDKTLKLFHLLDPGLCPNGWADGVNDTMETVFDRTGKMIDMNTESGDPERVIALVGPHYYTGEGTAVRNLSRTASFSNQHIIKRMMELGLYSPELVKTINYLGLQVGDVFQKKTSTEERLADYSWHENEKEIVKTNVIKRVAMALDDPLSTPALVQYKNSLADIVKELDRPLAILDSDLKTNAFDKQELRDRINTEIEAFNTALGYKDAAAKLTTSDVMTMVRCETGYTENDGRGCVDGLTYNQFINSVKRMKANVEAGKLPITGGTYTGQKGDVRAHIPLLPRWLTAKLTMSNAYSKYKGHDGVDQFSRDQLAELKEVTLPEVIKISNTAKRKALYRFADAVSYANGFNTISGNVLNNVYVPEIIDAVKKTFGGPLSNYDPSFEQAYERASRLTNEYVEDIRELAESRSVTVYKNTDDKIAAAYHVDAASVGTKILRGLAKLRRSLGISYAFMAPANILERVANQGGLSFSLMLSETKLNPFVSGKRINPKIAREIVKNTDFKKFYAAFRSAELLGAGRDLIAKVSSGKSLDEAVNELFAEQNKLDQWNTKFMNIMSGHDIFIEGQMRNFIDRFAQRAGDEAPWWHWKEAGSDMTLLERQLTTDPVRWMCDIFNGTTEHGSVDVLLAAQCLNWAKRGDMAQRNLVSAIHSEIASRSAAYDFFVTAFVSPYFQYATNRFGRIMQMILPVSSIHYVATEFLTHGPGKNLPFGTTGFNFGQLALEDVQFHTNLKEAMLCDIMHLGPQFVALILIGMAGAIEPPDDEDKIGNFKEWTIFGLRVDTAWWIEDILGLAWPIAVFGKSAQLGMPRLDLLTNGIAYYLSNNPAVKVADAVSIVLDPMSELMTDYDNDLEGYAKALGGPPTLTDIVNGKMTSAGISFVAQFLTPGFVREIYNGAQEFVPSYKRVYETDATGKLTEEGRLGKTQYTTYQDAIVRKYTRYNPIMGFLANAVLQPTTGYLAHEMPRLIIYDPMQMNSIEAFSLYNDPYTKKDPKTSQEQLAVCFAALSELQSKSVDQLASEGFMLDYDTKVYISKFIWDQIANINQEWYELEQAGGTDYYIVGNGDWSEGQSIVNELRNAKDNQINQLKSLYYDKLWADELKSPAQYNQRATNYAVDANGEYYATGWRPSWYLPVTLGPSESTGDYQYVMSKENDWATESVVTGESTGMRGLVPYEAGKVSTPAIDSWSTNGKSTGHSDIYKVTNPSATEEGEGSLDNPYAGLISAAKNSNGTSYYSPGRYGGGGGGGSYRSSSVPNIYAPSVNLPRSSTSRIANTDRLVRGNYDYLRPDFETKGSREAYKRSDI